MSKLQRIDKVLSNMGIGSRKEVKEYIKDGYVKINGEIISKVDVKVDPYEDEILFNGEDLSYREFIYIMMNKPAGMVSSTDDPRDSIVLELLDESYMHFRPFPVGRLDKDTEGLLLISNDGRMAHELLSPKKGINKTYYVEVSEDIGAYVVDKFKSGVVLNDGYETLPAELEILEDRKAYLTIQEGKYHQVKRMFGSVGNNVTYLKRVQMGSLNLDLDLEPGEYRELTDEEYKILLDDLK